MNKKYFQFNNSINKLLALAKTTLNIISSFSYSIFLLILLTYVIIHIYITSQFIASRTKTFPYLVLAVLLILIVIELALHLKNIEFKKDSEFELKYYSNKIAQGLWPFVYLAGYFTIGLFTTTFIVTVMYVVAHGSGDISTRFKKGVATSVGLVIGLYSLFIIMLDASVFLEPGFLP